MLALHNYHDTYGSFPPAYTADSNGRRLHSWRTLILPYMDQHRLYESIDLSKPWDDPVNAEAFESRPHVYTCPAAGVPDGHTTYMALVGGDHFLRESQPRAISEITGGTTNTAAVLEVSVAQAVHWMEPTDVAREFVAAIQHEHDLAHDGGVNVLLADGAVRFVGSKTASDVLQQLISVSESVTAEW